MKCVGGSRWDRSLLAGLIREGFMEEMASERALKMGAIF